MNSTIAKTPYLDAVSTSLPSSLSDIVSSFDIFSRQNLDTIVRFCLGGNCPEYLEEDNGAWSSAQVRLRERFLRIEPKASSSLGKHGRDEENNENIQIQDASGSKKLKATSAQAKDEGEFDGDPLYTLHSISVSSPIRKKVDITITPEAIRLFNPSTKTLESRVPLTDITRAFLVSNLGKNRNKPHWTVILLSADSWEKKDPSSQLQLTFSIDHSPSVAKDLFSVTEHPSSRISHPKGTETLQFLRAFLSHLPDHIKPVSVSDPADTSIIHPFMSSSGQLYVDAYRNAREGSLYFLDSGILWAESKPCEFYPFDDLAPDESETGASGVKTLSVTGRTFSTFIRRRDRPDESGDDEEDEEEMIEGEESEFAMIDGREQENVVQWIRKYKRRFGQEKPAVPKQTSKAAPVPQINGKDKGKGKATAEAPPEDADSDASDEDFVDEDDSDGGEPTSESESETEGEGGRGSASDDSEEDDEDGENDDEEGEMSAAHHPLLRPGAMPRMSKAAMDMAVGMVMDGLMDRSRMSAGDEDDELEDED